MEYVPLDLAFRVRSGFLDSKLTVSFVRAQDRPVLSVKGSADLRQFSLAELDGQPLLERLRGQEDALAVRAHFNSPQLSNCSTTSRSGLCGPAGSA